MSAPALLNAQQLFEHEIRTPSGASNLARMIVGDTRAGAATRVGIYADAYRLRLVEALAQAYPVLRAQLGERGFDRLGHAYLDANPSQRPSIRWFGDRLATFLSSSEPWSKLVALAELASFEWAQGIVFDAGDEAALGIEALAALPPQRWGQLQLQPIVALRRLDLASNAPERVSAHNHRRPAPSPSRARKPRSWIVWRDATLDVRWRSMAADEAAAWDALAAGECFGRICARLCDFVPAEAAPLRAASLLKRWLSDGLIASYG